MTIQKMVRAMCETDDSKQRASLQEKLGALCRSGKKWLVYRAAIEEIESLEHGSWLTRISKVRNATWHLIYILAKHPHSAYRKQLARILNFDEILLQRASDDRSTLITLLKLIAAVGDPSIAPEVRRAYRHFKRSNYSHLTEYWRREIYGSRQISPNELERGIRHIREMRRADDYHYFKIALQACRPVPRRKV
jgi:hypothetical protein